MAPQHQPSPAVNAELLAGVEATLVTARLVRSIERKVEQDETLLVPEITHLFELDTPLYARDRDTYVNEYWDEPDPDYDRKAKYQDFKERTRDASRIALAKSYGVDAVWLLEPYDDVKERVPELLANGADVHRLVVNLRVEDRIRHFDALQRANAGLHAFKLFEEYQQESGHNYALQTAFIRDHKELLAEQGMEPWHFVSLYKRTELFDHIEELIALGVERDYLARQLSVVDAEEKFDDLVARGFDAKILAQLWTFEYIEAHFDQAHSLIPEKVRRLPGNLESDQFTDEANVGRIIRLHEKGEDVSQHLVTLFGGERMTLRPASIEALVAGGIPVEQIVDGFDDYIFYQAAVLMRLGADADHIKSRMSAYAIISKRDDLRKAGIEVRVADYINQLSPDAVILYWRSLTYTNEDIGTTVDEVLDRFTEPLPAKYVVYAVEAGATPTKAAEMLAPKSIHDGTYRFLVRNGVPEELLREKANDDALKLFASQEAEKRLEEGVIKSEADIELLSKDGIVANLEAISKAGYINAVIPKLSRNYVSENVVYLATLGADLGVLANRDVGRSVMKDALAKIREIDHSPARLKQILALESKDHWKLDLKQYIEDGLTPQDLLEALRPYAAQDLYGRLLSLGVDKRALLEKCISETSSELFIAEHLDDLSEVGMTADELTGMVSTDKFMENVVWFFDHGTNEALLVARIQEASLTKRYPDVNKWLAEEFGLTPLS